MHYSQIFSSENRQQALSRNAWKKKRGCNCNKHMHIQICQNSSPKYYALMVWGLTVEVLLETVPAPDWASSAVLVRAGTRVTACVVPTKPCLAPTNWTGMWGGLWPPVLAWLLLGGAGSIGGGCRGGSCTGKRCPWAVLGWIGTGPLSTLELACWRGCTTRVCVLMLAFGVTDPIGYPWVEVATFEVGTRITGAAVEDRRSWERGRAGEEEEEEEGATEAAGVTVMVAWFPVFTAIGLLVDCWLKLGLAICCCCWGCTCCCWAVCGKACCCCWVRGKLLPSFLSGSSDLTATALGVDAQCRARFWT